MTKLNAFLTSEPFLSFYEKLWEVLLISAFLGVVWAIWRIISMVIKFRKLRKQFQKDCHFPGMENFRHFYKHRLKEHGVKIDDKFYESN